TEIPPDAENQTLSRPAVGNAQRPGIRIIPPRPTNSSYPSQQFSDFRPTPRLQRTRPSPDSSPKMKVQTMWSFSRHEVRESWDGNIKLDQIRLLALVVCLA